MATPGWPYALLGARWAEEIGDAQAEVFGRKGKTLTLVLLLLRPKDFPDGRLSPEEAIRVFSEVVRTSNGPIGSVVVVAISV